MKRLLAFLSFCLLLPMLSRAQAGTPTTIGAWYLLNEATDNSGETQGCYTPDSVNFVANAATITMSSQSIACGNSNHTTQTFGYKSGSIMWHDFNVKPTVGHNIVVDVRAKMANGWPAIWMLGGSKAANTGCQISTPQSWDNILTCNWANDASDSSEIDIGEACTPPVNTQFGGHHLFAAGTNDETISCYNVSSPTTTFHTYHLDWSTTRFCFQLDGVQQECSTNNVPQNPMFLIIENRQQSGGNASLPQAMTIQYVQVCDAGNGQACSTPGTPAADTTFFDNFAPPPAPEVFFTDLNSGPNSGGETVSGFSGAYVNIYGNNFGATQGTSTITWKGLNCLRPVSWGTPWLWYQKITVQLGAGCTAGTGNFVVNVNGVTSTAATVGLNGSVFTPSQFTVRATGNIRCVSTAGSDSNSGAFPSSCWATLPKAIHTMSAGDITYAEDGVTASAQDPFATFNAAISITSAGTAGNPIALAAYPGANVTINTPQNFCIRQPAVAGPGPHWTIAGINCIVTGNGEGFSFRFPDFRVVANTIQCPNSFGTAACVDLESDGTSSPAYMEYGNTWSNVGVQVNGQKTYHGMYFSAGDDHSDMGWNDLHGIHGCRAVQFFDQAGRDMGDVHVHDNVMHDVVCDAINFSTMNPDLTGGVEAYNNVMYNVGTGPDPPDGSANYSCYNLGSVSVHTASVRLYNNTCFNAGFSGFAGGSGCYSPNIKTVAYNNICDQANGRSYVATNASGCTQFTAGTNNQFIGAGANPCTSQLTASRNIDPVFVSTVTPDFHLQATSTMIGGGSATLTAVNDRDGLIRPSPPSIGAFEFTAGTAAPTAPAVSLSPTSIAYGNQILLTTSTVQTVTLNNVGTASLVISGIALTGANSSDFSISGNTCGASLGVGSNCVVSLTFTPAAVGSRSANVTFTTNASTSPDNVTLTGTGTQTDIYLAQAAAGSGLGTSCATAKAVSFFNASVNWGTNPGQIASGDTLHLCGIISSSLTVPASQGTGLITMRWESGASMQQPAASTFIGGTSTNLWVFTGQAPCGFVNQTFVACTEGIKNTANGSLDHFANQVNPSRAFDFSNFSGSSVTVQNLEIGPLYVHDDPTDTVILNTSVNAVHANPALMAAVVVKNNYVHDVSWAFDLTPTSASPAGMTLTFTGNELFHTDHGFAFGSTCATACYTLTIDHNHWHDPTNWNTNANAYHHDAFHRFNAVTQTAASYVYDNLFDGPHTGNDTAYWFDQAPNANTFLFNNIFIVDPTSTAIGLVIEGGGGPNYFVANNTGVQVNNGSLTVNNAVFQIQPVGNPSTNMSALNNIWSSGITLIDFEGGTFATNSATSGLDFNLYANITPGGSHAFVKQPGPTRTDVLATWQGQSGEGTHSQLVGDAKLSATGTPLTGSPAIGTGSNLTSLCIGPVLPLCSDFFGSGRPSSGSWNVGAIGNPGVGTPLAALSLSAAAFFNQMVGTATSLPMLATLSNNGTATLNISSISFAGTNAADFGQSNNCGAGIAAGNSCLITITFSPSATGPRSAILNVNDNASGSPQTVALTGNGMKTVSGSGTITGSGSIVIH